MIVVFSYDIWFYEIFSSSFDNGETGGPTNEADMSDDVCREHESLVL